MYILSSDDIGPFIYVFSVLFLPIGLLIFYLILRTAVKNGINLSIMGKSLADAQKREDALAESLTPVYVKPKTGQVVEKLDYQTPAKPKK